MGKWIQQALGVRRRRRGAGPHRKAVRVEALHKGALHRMLGVPLDEVIPLDVLLVAAKRPGLLGRRARLALTLRRIGARQRQRRRGRRRA